MIIDVNQIADLPAYLKGANDAVNLASLAPVIARTPELKEKQQIEIADLDLLIEADNLLDLLPRQNDPLFSIGVQKEMLPGIFADPYRHRVFTLAGFEDFNRGTFENCQAFEIDGIPTLVSLGTGTCKWHSRWYELPRSVKVGHLNWEIASARTAAAQSFSYSLKMDYRSDSDAANATPHDTLLANNAGPDAERTATPAGLTDVIAFRFHFTADVWHDSYLNEQHLEVLGESLGSPLLRAINVLERVPSPLSFFSLNELMAAADNYRLIEHSGQPPRILLATLGLNATLIGKKDQDVSQARYEFLQLDLKSSAFSRFEAKLNAEEYMRTTNE